MNVRHHILKNLLPPLIAIFLTYLFDKLVDLTFNLGPYDDSGTPGFVFLIEAVLIVILLFVGYLIHIFLIVKYIDKRGEVGYKKIFIIGLVIIVILSFLLTRFVYSDSNLTEQQVALEGTRAFVSMAVLFSLDLIILNMLKKYGA